MNYQQPQYNNYNYANYPPPPLPPDKSSDALKVIGIILSVIMIVVGGLMLTIAGLIFALAGGHNKCTAKTEATVIGYQQDTVSFPDKNGGEPVYRSAPVFSYEVDGKTYTYASSHFDDPPRYDMGETVTLKYAPDEPTFVYDPADESENDRTMAVMLVVGIVPLAAGTVMLVMLLVNFAKNKKPPYSVNPYYNNGGMNGQMQ